jgi:cytidylate kinase
MVQVVAIDGPVAVGKSSVARLAAAELGLRHINTGAMYRAVALKLMRVGGGRSDLPQSVIADAARTTQVSLPPDGCVLLDGEDVTDAIRDERVSAFVAVVADNLDVRHTLVAMQRSLGLEQPAVLEGRDIGTVVFPDAALKIYLDASPEVRADRRLSELRRKGLVAKREDVFLGLLERDERDRARPWGGLRMAEDATLIDTTNFDEVMVVRLIAALVREHPAFHDVLVASP